MENRTEILQKEKGTDWHFLFFLELPEEVLRPLHVPVPIGSAAYGPREGLHH